MVICLLESSDKTRDGSKHTALQSRTAQPEVVSCGNTLPCRARLGRCSGSGDEEKGFRAPVMIDPIRLDSFRIVWWILDIGKNARCLIRRSPIDLVGLSWQNQRSHGVYRETDCWMLGKGRYRCAGQIGPPCIGPFAVERICHELAKSALCRWCIPRIADEIHYQ